MLLGLDLSTQSFTAMVIDTAAGKIVACESVNFGTDLPQFHAPSGFIPGGTDGEVHADPRMWLDALEQLLVLLSSRLDLSEITHISGSGQQHGSVYLDSTFEHRLRSLSPSGTLSGQLAPALTRETSPIWMDTSTGRECSEISSAVGGPLKVCEKSGSVPTERFTGPQIRRLHGVTPSAYERTAHIHLVSSFISSVLLGKSSGIDLGDGAGMNLLNLSDGKWDADLLEATAPDLSNKLPPVSPTTTIQGSISPYFVEKFGFHRDCKIAHFTGDNPASLVGMGATDPGTVVVSLGTSDTFFAAMPSAKTDPEGYGHVFGNPAGSFMSLICFRNGSLAREALRDQHHLDWDAFDVEALEATRSEAGKNLMLPFFGPEITPRHDFEKPVLKGSPLFESGEHPGLQVRALLEGQFLNMRLYSQWMGTSIERIRLTGGASRNNGIARILADVFQAPVERLDVPDSAALGAALLAAKSAGEDLPALQSTFCKLVPGSTIEPDLALKPVYDASLVSFRDFLKAQ